MAIGEEAGESYLGDGLYVRREGFQLRLRAPRGFADDHEVYLDQHVLTEFIAFAKRCGFKVEPRS